MKGNIAFIIISEFGDTLRYEQFKSVELLDYRGIDLKDEKEKEKYILDRMDDFFNENNFYNPAIKRDENHLLSHYNQEYFIEFKSDFEIIAFAYKLGEDDGKKIAYSKIKRKVVVYFSCC